LFVLTLNAPGRLLFVELPEPVETFRMFRTPIVAALTVALLGGTAMAQPPGASAPPANLSNNARSAPDYDEDDAPPPRGYTDSRSAPSQQQAEADRDIFCRRDAAARTGYTTPREAARDEQTRGTVGGTIGGAVLGTVLGAAAGNAGLGAAAGAGAGLLAGTAIGADNARHAARDVEAAYADAYYGCMHQDNRQAAYDGAGYDAPPPPAYAYGPPPPPAYYYPYPYYAPYYGPSVSFGFGFGGGGWGHRGWGGGHGWHGGGFRGGRHH
jgi:hypothetical protein